MNLTRVAYMVEPLYYDNDAEAFMREVSNKIDIDMTTRLFQRNNAASTLTTMLDMDFRVVCIMAHPIVIADQIAYNYIHGYGDRFTYVFNDIDLISKFLPKKYPYNDDPIEDLYNITGTQLHSCLRGGIGMLADDIDGAMEADFKEHLATYNLTTIPELWDISNDDKIAGSQVNSSRPFAFSHKHN